MAKHEDFVFLHLLILLPHFLTSQFLTFSHTFGASFLLHYAQLVLQLEFFLYKLCILLHVLYET